MSGRSGCETRDARARTTGMRKMKLRTIRDGNKVVVGDERERRAGGAADDELRFCGRDERVGGGEDELRHAPAITPRANQWGTATAPSALGASIDRSLFEFWALDVLSLRTLFLPPKPSLSCVQRSPTLSPATTAPDSVLYTTYCSTMISAETDFEPAANGPFEGPEKLLEIWFAPSAADCLDATSSTDGKFGLRRVPRVVWEEMLDIVKCKILSVVEGTETDAYLLRCVPSVPNPRPIAVMYAVVCYLADRMHYQ